MTAKEILLIDMDTATFILNTYLSDFTEAEMLKRPVPQANHTAWQLGHLIASENDMLSALTPPASISLPEGFAKQHSKESAGSDDPAKFLTKAQYLELMQKVRAASKEALAKMTDADFNKPGPDSLKSFAPTLGALFSVIAGHPMMHTGQLAVLRRALGKPILM